MKKFKFFIKEETEKTPNSKHFFDIDETLFAHDDSKLRVHVKDPNGRVVRTLTNKEFNTHELPDNHSYDFKEFKSSDRFKESAKPIRSMIAKMKSIHRNGGNVNMLTARADFDDKNKFAAHMEKYGINIDPRDGIHVRRAGNLQDLKPHEAKAKIISDHIKTENLSKVHLYDDSIHNIKGMLKLKTEHPEVEFHGYHVQHEPETGKINITKHSYIPKKAEDK